jgi:hypothetical protein
MILGPNIACIAGVFTLGFGIGASVVTNNIAALAALANPDQTVSGQGRRPREKDAAGGSDGSENPDRRDCIKDMKLTSERFGDSPAAGFCTITGIELETIFG